MPKSESSAPRPHPHVFALQQLLSKLEMEMAPLAELRGLLYRTRETDKLVFSDPILLELILRNLIANAIRYTSRGGVLVACRRDVGDLRIEVVDTGPGIAAHHCHAIFRAFHRLDNATGQDGLGLGLAIVAALAQRLGHPVTLASREGRGSAFRVRVPLARPARPQRPQP